MINAEIVYIVLPAISWVLFALGGFGPKWVRRYVLPAIIGAFCLLQGAGWVKSIIVTVGYVVAFCLPYGDSMPQYWKKFLIGCTYALPSLILGFTLWQILIPINFIALFALSNFKITERFMPWKIWEGCVGGIIGITIAHLLVK